MFFPRRRSVRHWPRPENREWPYISRWFCESSARRCATILAERFRRVRSILVPVFGTSGQPREVYAKSYLWKRQCDTLRKSHGAIAQPSTSRFHIRNRKRVGAPTLATCLFPVPATFADGHCPAGVLVHHLFLAGSVEPNGRPSSDPCQTHRPHPRPTDRAEPLVRPDNEPDTSSTSPHP